MNFDLEAGPETEHLVSSVRGDIPVLLTVPHGGVEQPPEIRKPRNATIGYKPRATEIFSTSNDIDTIHLAFRVSEELRKMVGKAPYIIAARFDRNYVDVNRNSGLMGPASVAYENHAFDDPEGAKYYDAYHAKIREYIDEIIDRFKTGGLLFDLHSSMLQDKRIVVGMVTYDPADFQRYFRRGHVAVDHLLERFGFDPLYHPVTGLISSLHNQPLPENQNTEVLPIDRFSRASPSGGYTVITYGSNRPGGIDAFQLECSMKLSGSWLDTTANIYANAIQKLFRTVIEDTFYIETVYAGKLPFNTRHQKNGAVTLEFSLTESLRKNYPAVMMIHGKRITGKHNSVTLNRVFLGEMSEDYPVSLFHLEDNTLAALRQNRNELIIAASAQEHPTQSCDCEINKVSVIYCRR